MGQCMLFQEAFLVIFTWALQNICLKERKPFCLKINQSNTFDKFGKQCSEYQNLEDRNHNMNSKIKETLLFIIYIIYIRRAEKFQNLF